MEAEEKIYRVIKELAECRKIGPEGHAVLLDPFSKSLTGIAVLDIQKIIEKLDADKGVIEILDLAPRAGIDAEDACHKVIMLPEFNAYAEKIISAWEQAPKEKVTGKRGPKLKYDWEAYRKEFERLIEHYGMPALDQPELKNQAAIESQLIQWAEARHAKDAPLPSPASVRRYVSSWLKDKRETRS